MSAAQQVAWDISTVRKLLKWWGEYMRTPVAGESRLDYPSAANFLSVYFDRYRVRAPMAAEPKPIVKKVALAIKDLENIDAIACMALIYKYHYQWTIEHAAKQMKVSQPTYRDWVKSGEYFIMGKIF